MLDALRKSASGWVAKAFLGVLVLSFAVWGVADIFGGYGTQSVAEVGDPEVSTTAFQDAYRRELSLMADRLGRQLTPDEARALGVDRRVLSQLLTSAALTNQARDIKLGVSDEYIAQKIVTNPTFLDAFGRFNRERYDRILEYSGLSESAYVAEQQSAEVRQQLTETVRGDLEPPSVLVDAVREFQGARRVVDYILLPQIDAALIEAPDEAALKEYYSQNETQFTAPELRSLDLLIVEPADLTDQIEVEESEIEAEYAARRAEYETKEKRAVDQILFTDEDTAKAAHEQIAAGVDFLKVASDAGFSAKDVDLGVVTQADIVDPTIAESAFSMEKDAVSEPIVGALGTAIIRVRSIEPATTRPLAEVRDEIRDQIALDRARDEVLTLYDGVEDERAAGQTLKEISDRLNINYLEVAGTDRRGRDLQGEAVADLPPSPDLLRDAFESDVGLENDAVETRSGGFIWFDVTAITPPELKPFENVRQEVETSWREEAVATRRRDMADELVERARSGVAMTTLGEEVGAEVQTSEPFTRRSPTTPFAPGMVEAVFAAPKDTVLRGAARDNAQQAVVRVKELLPAEELSPGDAQTLNRDMTAALGSDIYEQYVSGLQARDGVVVNQVALNALFGDAN